MRRRVYFITGTDTGVGKTVLTTALTRRLIARGFNVAALKPLCSGSRYDAVMLERSMGGHLGLGYVNPWHFSAPLAPAIAARAQGFRVKGQAVVDYIRSVAVFRDATIVEGAGGLLSPLTVDLDAAG
jgi:dethiobiotin synthetase